MPVSLPFRAVHRFSARVPGACLALLLAFAAGCGGPAEIGVVRVVVQDEIIHANPPRLGVNIGQSTYYSDQQLVVNPFGQGAFPRGRQVAMIRTAQGSANSLTDADGADIVDSFAGGVYCIATGARAGEEGRITAHEKNEAGASRFILEKEGTPLADGDLVWLRGPWVDRARPDREGVEPGIGIGDWRLVRSGDTTVSLAPTGESEHGQAVSVHFVPGTGGAQGGLRHYTRATPTTNYRVHVRARSDMPGAELSVGMQSFGIPHTDEGHVVEFLPREAALTPEWREYTFRGGTYSDPRIAESHTAFSVAIKVEDPEVEGTAYFDDVWLEDRRMDSPTGFQSEVVETIREARCGVLRFYGISSLDALIEGITHQSTRTAPWSYLSLGDGYRISNIDAVVDDWMRLCTETGAQPWLTIGGANMPRDWRRLISYLAAPAGYDADADRRAAHGRKVPWIEAFDTIYLEIGNEWWNPIFRPYYTPNPASYGAICRLITEAVRSHPHYDEDRFVLVAGGWAVNARNWNSELDRASDGHDKIAIAPYLLHELNEYETHEQKYAPLFADVDAYARHGGAATVEQLAQVGKGTGLAVYELNTHTTGGHAPAMSASEICPSHAAGVAVLDQAMSLMAHFEASPINYFTLLQRAYGRGLGNVRIGLWGNLIRTPTGELRPRPIWHGLRMANQYLIEGDMVRVEVPGNPTWRQPANGSVPAMQDVPYIHAYAFLTTSESGERQANVLAINRHRIEPITISLEVPFEPAASVQRVLLSAESLRANNEELEKVRLRKDAIEGYRQGGALQVPAFSAVVYQVRAVK